ncbi:farnesoate epoxidase-like, partial [Hyposmocoma kahamanoa]|uniref:farnesoate epoxidase-like n=1 Tax=Hyposmocoma kahamanoa TaxID=1477025 RepID=UPI000E6D5F36
MTFKNTDFEEMLRNSLRIPQNKDIKGRKGKKSLLKKVLLDTSFESIVFTEGPAWSSGRRLMLKFLKNFGYGTNAMETIIAAECKALVELRLTDAGQRILVNDMFDITILNILWRLMAGKRYDLNDDRLKNICDWIRRSFNVVDMSGGVINFLPFLRHIFPGLTGYKELVEIYGSLLTFIREVTRDHQKNFDMNNPRDVIDMFLIERSRNKNSIVGTDEDLDVVCLDMLQAGMETVGNTVAFMFLYMVRQESIQNKVIAEIDDVIGKRTPTLEDRRRMTYTEAVVMETLRMSAVAPIGIPHRALDDAKLGNYIIPK